MNHSDPLFIPRPCWTFSVDSLTLSVELSRRREEVGGRQHRHRPVQGQVLQDQEHRRPFPGALKDFLCFPLSPLGVASTKRLSYHSIHELPLPI